MPDTRDTAMNLNNQFVFTIEEDTPQQVVNALDDFTTFIDLFEVRSREYGDGAAFFLGSKGQFSDIYRKIIKLKTATWDGKPEQLTSEGTEEVIYDLIGHLFLTLQCLRLENRTSMPIRGAMAEILDTSAALKRLRSESKPEEAKPSDPRDWWYDTGDKVKTVRSSGSWLDGEIGTIVRRRVEDGGLWYSVNFEELETGRDITCSQDGLEIVSRSQAWWDKHPDEKPKGMLEMIQEFPKTYANEVDDSNAKQPGRGEPTLVSDVERKANKPRKLRDNPQA